LPVFRMPGEAPGERAPPVATATVPVDPLPPSRPPLLTVIALPMGDAASTCRVPALIVTAPAPRAEAWVTTNRPPLTVVEPPKVFAAERVSVPGPDLIRLMRVSPFVPVLPPSPYPLSVIVPEKFPAATVRLFDASGAPPESPE